MRAHRDVCQCGHDLFDHAPVPIPQPEPCDMCGCDDYVADGAQLDEEEAP